MGNKFIFQLKKMGQKTLAKGLGHNLTDLARIYRTDKYGKHFYTQHYETHFQPFRQKPIKLLEIGVGGYDDSLKGGKSLRMWKDYFKKGHVYSLDIHDKSALEEPRIRIFKGSQTDEDVLKEILSEMGSPDLIIDDGSHVNHHVITTFKLLFPHLKEGGIYVVEDTQTSYWEEYGGDGKNLQNPSTMMNFFKSMIDGLNRAEFNLPREELEYFDHHIVSMHFYHNLIFIYKGKNDEASHIQR